MKRILKIMLIPCLLLIFSCEKDDMLSNYKELKSAEIKMESDLNKILGTAPNGWVMMVKSSLANDVYIPVVMKFDTTKNMVRMRSVYGTTTNNNSNYLINKGVSGILLNFSGGSVISSLMRMGAEYSDVTDYVFKVLEVTPDSIKIQCLKSGAAYKKEGGVIFSLFKRPDSWKWADEPLLLDMQSAAAKANINNKDGMLSLVYTKDSKQLNLAYYFKTTMDPYIAGWQDVDPFYTNPSANVYNKLYLFFTYVGVSNTGIIKDNDYTNSPVARQGHNALYYIPFTGNKYSKDSNATFIKDTGIPYLAINEVIRSGSYVTIKVAAYDKTGKDYISGEYRNFDK